MTKSIILSLLFSILFLSKLSSQDQDSTIIIIESNFGNIELLLYNDTPLHKSNMIKLVSSGYYKDQLFHRVIKDFMIQGGDPHSVGAKKGQRLGTGNPGYTIPAEIKPKYFHKRGALAAARQGDRINPQKNSSGSQFYIVEGNIFSKEQLLMMENSGAHAPFTEEEIKMYTTIGGSPHLDGSYTVFGEVIKGFDFLELINELETDNYDRPTRDITYSIRLKN